jgi:hypothetical protein
VKEKLFPGGENEITPTVDTLQHLVLKFHLRMAPFSPFPRAHPRGKNCGGRRKYRLSTSPLVLPLDSARHAPGRSVVTNYRALMPEMMNMNDPLLQLNHGGGQIEQSRPGKERPFPA